MTGVPGSTLVQLRVSLEIRDISVLISEVEPLSDLLAEDTSS